MLIVLNRLQPLCWPLLPLPIVGIPRRQKNAASAADLRPLEVAEASLWDLVVMDLAVVSEETCLAVMDSVAVSEAAAAADIHLEVLAVVDIV